jgi:hypothetical protein
VGLAADRLVDHLLGDPGQRADPADGRGVVAVTQQQLQQDFLTVRRFRCAAARLDALAQALCSFPGGVHDHGWAN